MINVILADNVFTTHPVGAINASYRCVHILINTVYFHMNEYDKEYLSLHDTTWRRISMTMCMCNNHCGKCLAYSCGIIVRFGYTYISHGEILCSVSVPGISMPICISTYITLFIRKSFSAYPQPLCVVSSFP